MSGSTCRAADAGLDLSPRNLVLLLPVAFVLAGCDLFSPDRREPVRVAWSRPLGNVEGGGWLGRPAIAGQTVFVQAGGRLDALDLLTGVPRWQRQLRTGLPINAENVLVAGGLVIVAGGDSVRAVAEDTGLPRWSHLPDGNVASCQIAAGNGAVFVGSRVPSLTALSLTSGQPLWNRPLGPGWQFEAIVQGVAVSGDTVYATITRFLDQNGFRRTGLVVALNAATGAELWRYTSPGDSSDVHGAPTVTASALVVADAYGRSFFALDRFSGQERWRVWTQRQFVGVERSPVVRNGRVFAAAQGGPYAVDELTGQPAWSRTDLLGASDIAVCGSVVLVQSLRIWVLEPASGRLLGTILEPEGNEALTSAIATSGSRAFVHGLEGAYGLQCD